MSTLFAINPAGWADLILTWLGHAVVSGTLLALVTGALVRVLRRWLTPALRCLLWLVVLLKFLVPLGPPCPLSLASLYAQLTAVSPTALPIPETWFGRADASTADSQIVAGRERSATPRPQADWVVLLTAIYLAGVACVGVGQWRHYKAVRRWYDKLPTADPATRDLVRRVCERLGVTRVPQIRVSTERRAPLVIGFRRPLLVLSHVHLKRPDDLETVIVHEVMHLRRSDLIVRALQCLAGVLLFFWPVIAWVNRQLDQAREQACDEWALRHGKLSPCEYARCLLEVAQPPGMTPAGFRPACMGASARSLERRIDVILATSTTLSREPLRAGVMAAFVLVWGLVALSGGVSPAVAASPDDAKYQPTEKSMREHAQQVYAQVNAYSAGDLNGNGQVEKEECWTFITAVALGMPQTILREFPEADHDANGSLGVLEAYEYFRGDYDLEKLHVQIKQEIEQMKQAGDEKCEDDLKKEIAARDFAAWHAILSRRSQVIALVKTPPTPEAVRRVQEQINEQELKQASSSYEEKARGALIQISEAIGEVTALRAKAQEVGGEKAQKLEQKAADIEQKIAAHKEHFVQYLTELAAKLDQAGEADQAAQVRRTITDFEAL